MKSSKARESSLNVQNGGHGTVEATLVSHNEVRKSDILLGRRGRGIRMHAGTVAFRAFINSRISEYERVKSRAQRINAVALATKSILDSGARILKPALGNEKEQWAVMDERSSCEKVGMAIRDSIKARQRHTKIIGKGDGAKEGKSFEVPSFETILNKVLGGLDERDGVERAQEQVSDHTATDSSSRSVSGLSNTVSTSPQIRERAVLNTTIRNSGPQSVLNNMWTNSPSQSVRARLLLNSGGAPSPTGTGMSYLPSSFPIHESNPLLRQPNQVLDIFVAPNQQSGKKIYGNADGSGSASPASLYRDVVPAAINGKLMDAFRPLPQDLTALSAMLPGGLAIDPRQRSTPFHLNSVSGANQNLIQHATIAAAQRQSLANQVRETSALLFRQKANLLRSQLRHEAILRSHQSEGMQGRDRLLHLVQQAEQENAAPSLHSPPETRSGESDPILIQSSSTTTDSLEVPPIATSARHCQGVPLPHAAK